MAHLAHADERWEIYYQYVCPVLYPIHHVASQATACCGWAPNACRTACCGMAVVEIHAPYGVHTVPNATGHLPQAGQKAADLVLKPSGTRLREALARSWG